MGFPGDSDGEESACSDGDPGSVPSLGRSPAEGNGYPLQYSCLANSMDRGVWSLQSGLTTVCPIINMKSWILIIWLGFLENKKIGSQFSL